ncbi:S1-like domain-containing RNA-binding protein [Proteiniborus sp. MB09-C3]|uniref:CvfB family protein n=1 Tax=Proteiniborus sp. MB09-C3 TaxID=3050072 RepID=UPI002553A402|nr:S1-like domain-containing RNA-binding protein [Proteiniborus sp. MB09-C3]WIV12997.1 S1-like domain-containing RNA-binding protein [Proteiniborus sp. MB09-C3]
MIELGKVQKLQIIRETDFGVYLNTEDRKAEVDVLLPIKQVPEGIKKGDEIEVFIYKDSEDRLIATTKMPKLVVGEVGVLRVVETTRIGAFLDWGLEKDLLLPFKEQIGKAEKGREYLVGLYVDKSNRLCATMKVNKILSSDSPYKVDDKIHGIIYRINKDMGAFVAVDNKYDAMIPKHELYWTYRIGDKIEARVTKVRDDGKLALSLREKGQIQTDEDIIHVLTKMIKNGGVLMLNDDSSPEEIKEQLNMSKGAYKKVIGRLLKERKIEIIKNGVRLL